MANIETSILVHHKQDGDSRDSLMVNNMNQRLKRSVLTVLLVLGTLAACALVNILPGIF